MTKLFRAMVVKFQHAAQSSREPVETQPCGPLARYSWSPYQLRRVDGVYLFPTLQKHIRYFALVA